MIDKQLEEILRNSTERGQLNERWAIPAIKQLITQAAREQVVKELERLKLKCWRQDTQMGDNPDTFAAVVFVDEIRARIKELKGEL